MSKLQKEAAKQLQPKDSDRHIRLYGDWRIAVSGSSGSWYEVQPNGAYQLLETDPIPETKLYIHRALIDVSSNILIAVDVQNEVLQVSICYDKQITDLSNKVSVCEILSGSSSHPVNVHISGANSYGSAHWRDLDLADRAAETLKLGAAIARDFHKFLDRPHEWIRDQHKQPKPTDAVLGGIKP